MHLMMITLMTMGSAVGQVQANPKGANMVAESDYDDCYDEHGGHGHGHHWANKCAIHNTSPQTCYAPRFGCYHSNERHMNRYPAFHGTFYRQAYNYRNYFDYPWHAELHEPTSLFSYNVGEDERAGAAGQPPQPPQARRPTGPSAPQVLAPIKSAAPQPQFAAPPASNEAPPTRLTSASSRQISSRRQ